MPHSPSLRPKPLAPMPRAAKTVDVMGTVEWPLSFKVTLPPSARRIISSMPGGGTPSTYDALTPTTVTVAEGSASTKARRYAVRNAW